MIKNKSLNFIQQLNSPGIFHGCFSRHGGVSPAPFNSLNVGRSIGDEIENVQYNRQLIKDNLGISVLASARQVHEDKVVIVEDVSKDDFEFDGYDALITKLPEVGLMIQQADCQAVMLYDPKQRAIANIHSGWRGSVLNIIGKTIGEMSKVFGSSPFDLLAAISPSLGPCCAEFKNYKSELPPDLHGYRHKSNYFDFWQISIGQLTKSGVRHHNICCAEICTVCDESFFSYRREGHTGRFASVIGLKNE